MTTLKRRAWPVVRGLSAVLAFSLATTGCDSLDPQVRAEQPHGTVVADEATSGRPTTTRGADLGLAHQLSSAFEDVAELVSPSVVSVSTRRGMQNTMQQGSRQPQANPFEGTPFGDLFDHFSGPGGPHGPGFQQPQEGLGSGFVVSAKDGYILTNAHVVEGADEITVRTADERDLEAKLVGSDPQTDLAVLKVEDRKLAALELGDSDSLRVGQWVVAAGTPFGLSSSITSGIVSATGRSNLRIADYENFIQTDAAINPGNSGGPLLDLEGRVVGINTAIFSRSGGYMGIGFAIPINMARNVMNSLISDGKVTRGRLGAWIQDLNDDLAASFDYDSRNGVLIGDVDPESPAGKAGLQSGDIVLEYDGEPVTKADDLRMRVAGTKPGEEVELEIYRDGKRKNIDVEIGELENGTVAGDHPAAQLDQGVGMTARTLTPDIGQELGLDADVKGAVVTEVEPFGPAADAGIRQGDVIVQVHNAPVRSAEELRRELGKSDLEKGVRVVVLSGGSRRFAVVKSK